MKIKTIVNEKSVYFSNNVCTMGISLLKKTFACNIQGSSALIDH